MTTPVYTRYRNALAEAIALALGMPVEGIVAQVVPADPAHADLSFATFPLAKAQRKAPPAIAADLAQRVVVPGLEIKAVGPYVNARFNPTPFTNEVLDAARAEGLDYGHNESGAGKTVVIDYSSPNIAKPIGYHHIRSTVIGHAIANLYRSQGWRVEGINYLGDWGKQFGLVAVGFQEYGDPARKNDMAHVVDVYRRANARAEKEPEFDARARAFFKRMEDNDPEAIAFWKEFRELSLKGFEPIYARLGIRFEHYDGESLYQGRMDAVIDEVTRTVGTKESQGALIVDMPYPEGEPPVLLKKNDGTTLYATRDLAAAEDRYERFHFDRALYVVAQDQALHFRQFFAVLERMGKPWAKNLIHVNFGRVGGMSTRAVEGESAKPRFVLLNDVLDEAKKEARLKVDENIAEGRIQTDDADLLAEQIGLGAIVFGDLKNRRTSDYEFSWDEILSFQGFTGVYLQFAHARTNSILRKGGGAPASYDATLLTLPEERALVRLVAQFPQAVSQAFEQHEPSVVARYLLDLAAAFHGWFTLGNQDHTKRVLVDDAPVRAARLVLTDATRITLAAGLKLLGVATPEKM